MHVLILSLCLVLAQDQEQPEQKPPTLEKVERISTATRTEADPLLVPSSTTVITREDIRTSYALNVVDVLKRYAGVFPSVIDKTHQGTFVDLRGFNTGSAGGQNTLVLVDGRKTNDPSSSATDWPTIPLENIERIEIVRGPAASMYGDTAVAGVINIITRSPDKNEHRIGGAGGSYQVAKGHGALALRDRGTLYYVFADGINSHNYRENSDFSSTRFNARFEDPLDENLRLYVKLGAYNDNREFPGNMTKAQIDALGRRDSDSPRDHADHMEVFGDMGLVQQNSMGELSLFTSYTRRDRTSHLLFGAWNVDSDDTSHQLQATLKQTFQVTPFGMNSRFVVGVDGGWEELDATSVNGNPATSEVDYNRRLFGSFANGELHLMPDLLIFTASIRYDRSELDYDRKTSGVFPDTPAEDDKSFDSVNPMAGVTVLISKDVGWYASVGRTFRFPNRDELVGPVASNFELDPMRSIVYETGVKARIAKSLRGSLAVFLQDVKGEIYWDNANFINRNLERTRHAGIETELMFTPIEELDLFASYTLNHTRITAGPLRGGDMPVTPRHSGTIGATLRPVQAVSWNVTGTYVGTRALANDPDGAGDDLPDYFLLESKVAYQYDNLTFFASGSNLTDREYYDYGVMGAFGPPVYFPAPEINFLVGFEASY